MANRLGLPDEDAAEGPDSIPITTDVIIDKLQNRANRRKTSKQDRLLLMNAAYAIHQLVERLAKYEMPGSAVM